MKVVNVIGGGLAGVEASWYLAKKGIKVNLFEMRGVKMTPAHHSDKLAELVCSNSLKNMALNNASGLLKKEMELFDSLILKSANLTAVPAGGALAVDRENFAAAIEKLINNEKNITIIREEVTKIPDGITILATGPLTSEGLINELTSLLDNQKLYFYDASAPLIVADSIDYNKVYRKNRYQDEEEGDYLNCPFTKDEFLLFYQELINGKRVELKDFEKEVHFESCLPIEIIAKRGSRSLTFGPMKPIGLNKNGLKPFAVVQLRQDDVAKSLYNMVGFQTNLTYPEQKRIFRLIPGLENAEFMRYGLMHKNIYLPSPVILNNTLNLKHNQKIFIAGQLSGVEGYIESAATGIMAGINAYRLIMNLPLLVIPETTITGALIHYITSSPIKHFQPMNSNWGIVNLNGQDKLEYAEKQLKLLSSWIKENNL